MKGNVETVNNITEVAWNHQLLDTQGGKIAARMDSPQNHQFAVLYWLFGGHTVLLLTRRKHEAFQATHSRLHDQSSDEKGKTSKDAPYCHISHLTLTLPAPDLELCFSEKKEVSEILHPREI